TPYVAIDRLRPNSLARIEIAADQSGVDTRVECRGVKGNQAAFGVASDANSGFWRRRRLLLFKPIDGSAHLLHFIANGVPTHVKRLAIQPFTIGLLRALNLRIAGGDQAA